MFKDILSGVRGQLTVERTDGDETDPSRPQGCMSRPAGSD